MSQSVPLTKLMPRYDAAVETFQRRKQQDNTHHLSNMLNAYGYALNGGACSASLSYLEKKLANRDNYNIYRTQKDAEEWMKVDKKIHSYLGRDMMALSGGQDLVPSSKEPQLVQTLRLLSAFINNLLEKMMTARRASLEELQDAVNMLLRDASLRHNIKTALYSLSQIAANKYQRDLERDALDLADLEYDTLMQLAPSTAECILKCGITKDLLASKAQSLLFSAPKPSFNVPKQLPRPRILDEIMRQKSNSSLSGGSVVAGGGGAHHQVQPHVVHQQPSAKPQFRSRQAAQLYNIISAA